MSGRALVLDHGAVLTDGPEMVALAVRARAAGRRTALVSDAHAVPEECTALFDVACWARRSACGSRTRRSSAGSPPGWA